MGVYDCCRIEQTRFSLIELNRKSTIHCVQWVNSGPTCKWPIFRCKIFHHFGRPKKAKIRNLRASSTVLQQKQNVLNFVFISLSGGFLVLSLSCTFTPLSPFCSLSLSPFRFGTSLITRFSDCVVVVVESFESSTSYAIWPVCVISTTDEEQRVTQPNSSIFNDYQELLVVEGQTCVCVCSETKNSSKKTVKQTIFVKSKHLLVFKSRFQFLFKFWFSFNLGVQSSSRTIQF